MMPCAVQSVLDTSGWRGTPVVIHLCARKFFCGNPDCRRRIFAEQLSGLVAWRGRNSTQLEGTLVDIGLECGGEPWRRLAAELGISASGVMVQVANRFHLHVNLREAVVRMLERHPQDVTAAVTAAANPQMGMPASRN
jgi:hypothetical protein